nr:hypothetical protein Itr_chr11CG20340 [Ipomoea trifida]
MFGSILFGPGEVKGAMAGAGFTPRTVSPGRRVAVGFSSVLMYSRIASNSHGTQGNADYMDTIGDCLVECFKNITVKASSFIFVGKSPADLIDCEADEWCPAGGSPIAEPTESGGVSNSPTSND